MEPKNENCNPMFGIHRFDVVDWFNVKSMLMYACRGSFLGVRNLPSTTYNMCQSIEVFDESTLLHQQ